MIRRPFSDSYPDGFAWHLSYINLQYFATYRIVNAPDGELRREQRIIGCANERHNLPIRLIPKYKDITKSLLPF